MQVWHCLLCVALVWIAPEEQATASDPPDSARKRPLLEQLPTQVPFRVWSDQDGTHHAEAVLLGVKDGIAHFRKPNGKRALIALDRLSEADQRYIAASQSAAKTRQDLPVRTAARDSKTSPEENVLPANLVYVQVSRRLLADYVERTVDRDTIVSDSILDTSITGTAHTQGKTDLVLDPDPNQAAAFLRFSGTIQSNTVGYNGPAILHSSSQTSFLAQKQLTLDSSGLHLQATVAKASTSSSTNGIEISLPGLRGRIGERVAWRRVNETRGQADAIAARHVEARIEAAVDQQINSALSKVHGTLATLLPRLPFDRDRAPPRVQFSTTGEHLVVVMYRPEATEAERKAQPPPIEGDPDIAARVHRTAFRRAMGDPDILSSLAPMLANMLKNRAVPEGRTAAIIGVKTPAEELGYDLMWSPDRQWLTLDYSQKRTVPPEVSPPSSIQPSTPPSPGGFPVVKANPAARPPQAVAISGQ